MQPLQLIGKRFGKLTVLARSRKNRWGQYTWRCQCECSRETVVTGTNLIERTTRSCGCLRKTNSLTHGHARGGKPTPELRTFFAMHYRCDNKDCYHWKDYGGRGIKVCKRWSGKNGFIKFLRDMGPRPKGMSLDRIKVNEGYSPLNCRWATSEIQTINRRSSTAQAREAIADWTPEGPTFEEAPY